MRFLFTTTPGSGHFHPLVPTARALRRRGHDVAFAASPTFAPAIEAAGFDAHPAGPAWLENLADPVMQKILAGEFFVDLIRMGMVEGVMRAAKATGADAIVRETAELGGLVAGAILDLPVASAAAGAAKMYWPMIRPGVARAAAEHGLDGERVTADRLRGAQDRSHPGDMEMPDYVAPAERDQCAARTVRWWRRPAGVVRRPGRRPARVRDPRHGVQWQRPPVQADRRRPGRPAVRGRHRPRARDPA